jgi:serine/threonine protein kinase
LKLIDFGLAIEMPRGKKSVRRNFVGGTKDFLSPETLSCYVVEEGSLRERSSSKVG